MVSEELISLFLLVLEPLGNLGQLPNCIGSGKGVNINDEDVSR